MWLLVAIRAAPQDLNLITDNRADKGISAAITIDQDLGTIDGTGVEDQSLSGEVYSKMYPCFCFTFVLICGPQDTWQFVRPQQDVAVAAAVSAPSRPLSELRLYWFPFALMMGSALHCRTAGAANAMESPQFAPFQIAPKLLHPLSSTRTLDFT